MALGTNYVSITTAANFIPEIWSKKANIAAEEKLIFAKLVERYDSDVMKYGDTVHIPSVSNLSVQNITAGSELTLNAVTETKTDISINIYRSCAFTIDEMTMAQSQYDLPKIIGAKAGYAVAENIDAEIASLVPSFSQNVGTYAAELGDEQILEAIRLLDVANAPQTDRAIVIHPNQKKALMKVDKYYDSSKASWTITESPIKSGRLPDVYGIPVYVTTNVYSSGSNISNVLMHKEALGLAIQKEWKLRRDYIPQRMEWLFVAAFLMGLVEVKDTFGVELKG